MDIAPGFLLWTAVFLAGSALTLRAQPAAGAVAPSEGATIFHDRCAKCHGEKGEGVSAIINIAGPNIQAVHDPGDVMAAMEVGPGHMPRFADLLTVEQMHAVASYVAGQIAVIPLRQGNVPEGGKLFREYCSPCHRTAVRGGALVYTDQNAPDLVNKSRAIIAGAIRWGPGAMPAFPPSVLNQEQLDDVVAYVSFVQHPPSPGGTALNWYGPVAEGFIAWVAMFACIGIVRWIEKGGTG